MRSNRPTVRDAIAMVAIVAVGCIVTIAWAQRIGVNDGDGWDGQAYVAWAREFRHEVFAVGVTPFQSQRVLPSAIVYYAASALGVGHAHEATIVAFQVLDAISLVITAGLLWRIAIALEWSRAAAWAAFVSTFACFAVARHALYYPTLTDPMALMLGTATLWAFIERRPIAQIAIALASAVTWPVLFAIGIVLVALPRPTAALPATTGRWHRPVAALVGAAVGGIVTAWLVEELVVTRIGTEHWLADAHHALYPLTIAVCVATSGVAAYLIARADRTWSLVPYARAIGARRLVLGAIAASAIVLARHLWIARVAVGDSVELVDVQHIYAALAVRGPAWNLVHHVVYFGPIIIVVLATWRRIAATFASWGPGAVVALASTIVVAVTTESRQLTHALPLLVVGAIPATADRWTLRRVSVFAVVCLLWSKVWLDLGNDRADPSCWHDLRYEMHQGPWATDATYIGHFAAAIATGIALFLLIRERRTS